MSVSYGVPFTPRFHWTIHPGGHFLTGLSSSYRIDLARDDGVLRIERSRNPVAALDEERAYSANALSEDTPVDPGLGLGRPDDPRPQTVLPGVARWPGRTHMGAAVDRGTPGGQ